MSDNKGKLKKEPALDPTLANLESIQKSFDKAKKEAEKKGELTKEDFKSV